MGAGQELLLLGMPGQEAMTRALADALAAEHAMLQLHRYPSEEVLVTLPVPVAGRRVVIVCSLDRPDAKCLPLFFAADCARELGARQVGLCAPYLAYLRQDKRFHAGEAVTSRSFAALISARFDFLLTLDPHLHRYKSLAEIYTIPALAVTAAGPLADWIGREVVRPVIIGPDEESAQWVAVVADRLGVPWAVMTKVRHGDFDVEVTLPDLAGLAGRTPVLVDDIIESGRTLVAAVQGLRRAGLAAPVCLGVHALFAGDAGVQLVAAGAARIGSCNAIVHASNRIDVAPVLAGGLARLLAAAPA